MGAKLFIKFKNWLRRSQTQADQESSESIHQLAFRHGLDRRRHPRVNFPKNFYSSQQPFFEYMGIRFDVVDLSRGGVCLSDPSDDFNIPMGSSTDIHWVSPKRKEKLSLQLVGMSFQKKHFEFKTVSRELGLEIENFLESGIWGQKMSRSNLSIHTHLESATVELWIGIQGENLSFYSDPHRIASLNAHNLNVQFYKGSLPVYGDKARLGEALPVDERLRLLFFLSNLPVLSTRVINLLNDWAKVESELIERAG